MVLALFPTTVVKLGILGLVASVHATQPHFNDTWPSLDSRVTPQWFMDMKFAVSLHWGVYSVPAFSCSNSQPMAEWYWNYMGGPSGPSDTCVGQFHKNTYGADFTYEDFASKFRAELYNNAQDWATMFAESGVRMAVLTSKHHDGYELWPSPRAWNWNSMDVGPKMDLVDAFMTSMRSVNIRAGVYHSVFEWFNPLLNGPTPQAYVTGKLIPDLKDIVTKYEPDMLLMDGEWDHPSDFWQTRPFLAWLFNDSPVKDTIVVDDRWGNECRGAHGGVFICENGGLSAFCSGSGAKNGSDARNHGWAYWATQARSWGFSRPETLGDFRGPDFFIPLLVTTVVDGGVLIMNLGPRADGSIPPEQESIIRGVGAWLKVNGEGIYNTTMRRGGPIREVTGSAQFGSVFSGNLVNGVPVAQSTGGIVYLGKTNGTMECEEKCRALGNDCTAFTWHDETTGDYKQMCYGRKDATFNVVNEPGHFSAERQRVTSVQYTSNKAGNTLFAFIQPYRAGNLTLDTPVVESNATISLMGYRQTDGNIVDLRLKYKTSAKGAGVTVVLPEADPEDLVGDFVYGLRMVGAH